MTSHRRSWFCVVAFTVALAAAPLQAAELDKFLPDDTKVIASVNVRQIIDSPLAKKYELAKEVEKGLQSSAEAGDVLKSLGLDPLKDIHRVTFALPGKKDQKQILICIHGSFDLAKIHEAAEKHTKEHPEHLSVSKVGSHRLYEVKDKKEEKIDTTYVVFLNKEVLVASPTKAYVMDAIAKSEGKREAKFSSDLKQLVARQDGKQSVWAVALATDDMKAELENIPQTKQLAAKLESISFGATLSSDVKLSLALQTNDEMTAKDIKQKLEGARGIGLVAVGGIEELKDFAPIIIEILKDFKFNQEKGNASVELTVAASTIEKAAGLVKQLR